MKTISLDDYANKYESFHMERRDGILEVALHTNGGSMIFSKTVHDPGFLTSFPWERQKKRIR